MTYAVTITFDTMQDLAAWFRSNGQNVGSTATVTNNVTDAVPSAPEADPWTDGPSAPSNPAPSTSAPSNGASSGVPRTFTVNTPKGPQTWTLNAGNAPMCNCGQSAAFQEGSTNGRDWKRWTCAKAADKQNYKSKCQFNQFS